MKANADKPEENKRKNRSLENMTDSKRLRGLKFV